MRGFVTLEPRLVTITVPEEVEIRARVRGDQHAKLRALRMTTGEHISIHVVKALDLYLEKLRLEQAQRHEERIP